MLESDGYELVRKVFHADELSEFRTEADRLSTEAGTACVRHIREKSPLFRQLPLRPELIRLLPADLQPVRSILFDKTPSQNWPVAWHQDLTISVKEKNGTPGYGPWSFKDGSHHVQPPAEILAQMVTIRIHLDETQTWNGALKIIPQSHRRGKMSSHEVNQYDKGQEVVCECDPGDLLLMKPLVLHSSARSKKPSRRRVLHFEYAPQIALVPELEWLEIPHSK